jgi:cell fate regulator YaaT (PSP1 superfamily)
MVKYVVRYGSMRALGLLTPRGNDRYDRGMRVIARTNRGLEAADVLCEATEEMAAGLEDSSNGQILRQMTSDDINEWTHIQSMESKEFEICQRYVEQLGLEMELVDVEHMFGGERVVVYYLAEHRVDFRELVKQLASEFQTRIEMRQIGVRDEAKLLADFGDCGQEVCCGRHLTEMPPVSMKMAKLQKATLDPTKISGRCGRLKCCLRYEYDTYRDMKTMLPRVGSDVVTEAGRARVLGHEVLAQQLHVQMEDNRRMLIDLSDVLSVIKKSSEDRRRNSNSGPANS